MYARYEDGMHVSYKPIDDTLSVVFENFGVKFDDFEIAINGLINNAVFTQRAVNIVASSGGNVLLGAAALCSPVYQIITAFDNMSPYEEQSTITIREFEETFEAQKIKYSGNVVRGIAASTGKKQLTRTGHEVHLIGKVTYTPSLGTQWIYGYGYGCQTSLL